MVITNIKKSTRLNAEHCRPRLHTTLTRLRGPPLRSRCTPLRPRPSPLTRELNSYEITREVSLGLAQGAGPGRLIGDTTQTPPPSAFRQPHRVPCYSGLSAPAEVLPLSLSLPPPPSIRRGLEDTNNYRLSGGDGVMA